MIEVTVFCVAAFSLVQSLFGVGLLVFGTPTFLLLGYSFPGTLAILLPASLAVSLLQVQKGPKVDSEFARQFLLWCLPALAVSLTLVLTFQFQTSLTLYVAVLLAAFAVLRAAPLLGEYAKSWIADHAREWFLLMGAVHGLSNLGGALLTIYAAARYKEKDRMRAAIALCYSYFAAIQLAILAVLRPDVFGWSQLAYAVVAAGVFMIVGQPTFRGLSAAVFDRLLTAFVSGYAILLALKFAKVL
jgi:uncharacterized membrane protein YfcA